MLEKILESPLGSKEIKLVNPQGNQPWIFIGRTDAEAEAPIIWPPDAKSQFIGKYPDAGKDWGQKEKGTTEDEMTVWHHHLSGHVSEQTLGHSEGEGSLVYCSPRVHKESIQLSNWTIMNNRRLYNTDAHPDPHHPLPRAVNICCCCPTEHPSPENCLPRRGATWSL